jgi:hypothetical protein
MFTKERLDCAEDSGSNHPDVCVLSAGWSMMLARQWLKMLGDEGGLKGIHLTSFRVKFNNTNDIY